MFFGQSLQTQVPVLQLSHFEESPPQAQLVVALLFGQDEHTHCPPLHAQIDSSPPQAQTVLVIVLLALGHEEQTHWPVLHAQIDSSPLQPVTSVELRELMEG